MAHAFEYAVDRDRAPQRLLGWETVDVRALARVIEVDFGTLRHILAGAWENHGSRARIVQLVGIALGIGKADVERRIGVSRDLRRYRREKRKLGEVTNGRRSSSTTGGDTLSPT